MTPDGDAGGFVGPRPTDARLALEELVGALEDAWRRYLAGDLRAPESSMLRATYRQACRALTMSSDETLLRRLEERARALAGGGMDA